MNKRRLIRFVLLCMVMGIIWLAAGSVSRNFALSLFSPMQSGEEEQEALIQSILPDLTEELNVDAPYMIDPVLRFDEAIADTDNLRITYYNTFVSLKSADTDFQFIEEHLPGATHYMCNDAGVKKLMSYGVSFVYVYRGEDGVPVKSFTFVNDDC